VAGRGSLVQLFTTLDDRARAVELARAAVDAHVAACVQIVGPITSVYRWEGSVEETEEYLCLFKAPVDGLDRLVAFVREGHPYDTPELTAVESGFVDERYLSWTVEETQAST
jgi:periplasmic divalent cation tolerance protein